MKIYGSTEGQLFYDKAYPAENLYYVLYYTYVDSNDRHFERQLAEIDAMSHEEMVRECLSLAKEAGRIEGISVQELFTLYEFPDEVQSAIDEVLALLPEPEHRLTKSDVKKRLKMISNLACQIKNLRNELVKGMEIDADFAYDLNNLCEGFSSAEDTWYRIRHHYKGFDEGNDNDCVPRIKVESKTLQTTLVLPVSNGVHVVQACENNGHFDICEFYKQDFSDYARKEESYRD